MAKVSALSQWQESDAFTEQERLVLEYGERMTITSKVVDEQFFAKLKVMFSDAEIVELTAGIAMENFRSKFNAPLQIESQGFCLLPERM